MNKPLFFTTLILSAVFITGCNLTQPAETPVPTADIPRVTFQSPLNNSTVIEFTDFPIDIWAEDSVGINKIELYVDGEKHNEASPVNAVSVPVFRVEMNWLAQGVGKHTLSAIAYRLDGRRGDETIINIEVLPRPE